MAKNKNFKNFTYADDISIIQSLTSNRNYYPTQAVQTKQCTLSDKCFLSTRAIFLLISFHGPCYRKQETTETKTIPSYPVKGRGGGGPDQLSDFPCKNILYLDYEEPISFHRIKMSLTAAEI